MSVFIESIAAALFHRREVVLTLRFFLLFLIYVAQASALIVEVSDIKFFKKEITTLDNQSLVVFDVDETLSTPVDPFFRGTSNLPANCKIISQNFGDLDLFLEDEVLKGWKEIWIGKICAKMQFQLVDPEFSSIIQYLQQNKIKTIALTAIPSKSFGVIPSMADWRVQQLQRFDINFSQAFPDFSTLSFNLQSGNPSFEHGILFADTTPKGEALLALLEKIKWTPSKIIFIDDRLHYLQSVEEMTGKLGIDFVGFHYKASELISCLFDEEIAAFRFRYLAEKGEWLTEDEANILLHQY